MCQSGTFSHECWESSELETTWTASMTQQSPTSNGCITKRNIIATNTVLAVLPNMKATSKSWDEIKPRTWNVKKPIIRSHTIVITISTITDTSILKSWMAVLESFSECTSDQRSR